jgi:NDP-sugar pyrophosphorylase family protein
VNHLPSTPLDVEALVLAAGRSTRIAGELAGRSKLLVDIGGQTVLERNLRWLREAGILDVWINLHYRPDDIHSLVGDGTHVGLRVHYSHESELLGTAGAFRKIFANHASRPGARPVLLVYGDNVSRFDLHALVRRHRDRKAMATVALFDVRVHGHSGIAGGRVVVEDDVVVDFVEGRAIESPLVNAGVYVLQPEIADHIAGEGAPDFGRDVFPALLARGARIAGHVIEPSGYCFGIDTPEALARARAALPQRLVQQ